MQVKLIALKIESWIHAISKASHAISALVLFLMMALMTVDVIGRYLFKQAITGSVDFVVIMMVIFIFLSFSYTTYRRNHVRTDVLYDLLSVRKKAIFDIITIGLSTCIMILITWQLASRAIKIILNPPGLSTAYFSWPHYPFMILGAICCGLMSLELLIWFIESINKSIKG